MLNGTFTVLAPEAERWSDEPRVLLPCHSTLCRPPLPTAVEEFVRQRAERRAA
ncbi:hypothetical protein AB0368_36575 [Actinoplanes sp. NPDC051475]|uniref:hypothetical protein n=1 Tax=Actinoplanes sp. NPDC051475 TaxID=3157225 RepID=UPI00344D2ECF